MGGKIATLTVVKGSSEYVAKEVAMQAAAMKPLYLDIESVPEEVVDNEQPRNKKSYLVLFLFFMLFSGATEQAIAQWASAYAEIGLNVDKTLGDLVTAPNPICKT